MKGTRLLELTTADSAGGRRSRGGEEGEGRGGEGRGGEGGELKVMVLLVCTCVVYVQCKSVVPYISGWLSHECEISYKYVHCMKLHAMPRLL